MLGLFKNPEKQRQKLLQKVPDGPLHSYLEKPLPSLKQAFTDVEFLALDFETTGIDYRKEAILSVGYTVIRNGRVILGDRGHHLIRVNKDIPAKSVVIHQITDTRAQTGTPMHDVLAILLEKMAGKAILVHYEAIERNFINAACEQLYGYKPPMLMFDTLEIERKKLMRLQQQFGPHHLRLFNLREQYGLPRYNAHSALEDALATAELFLAEMSYRNRDLSKIRLKDI